jgi:hypothetical protein
LEETDVKQKAKEMQNKLKSGGEFECASVKELADIMTHVYDMGTKKAEDSSGNLLFQGKLPNQTTSKNSNTYCLQQNASQLRQKLKRFLIIDCLGPNPNDTKEKDMHTKEILDSDKADLYKQVKKTPQTKDDLNDALGSFCKHERKMHIYQWF